MATKRGEERKEPLSVDSDLCVGCQTCLTTFGCSAIKWDAEAKKATIDVRECVGCGDCIVVCPVEAIKRSEDA